MTDPRLRAKCPHCAGPVSDLVLLVGEHADGCPNALYVWKNLPDGSYGSSSDTSSDEDDPRSAT